MAIPADQDRRQIGGYVRAIVKRALMLQPTEGDDLPACLCADYQAENVRFCRRPGM